MHDRYVLSPDYAFVDEMRIPHRLAYLEGSRVMVHDLQTNRRSVLYTDEGGHPSCPLAWSPDGREVFHSHARQLLALGVRRRKTTVLARSRRGNIIWHLDCSPDGKQIAFLEPAGHEHVHRIRMLDRERGTVRTVSGVDRVWHFACDWERERLVVATLDPALWRIEMDGDGVEKIFDGTLVDNLRVTPDGASVLYEITESDPTAGITGSIWRRDLRTRAQDLIVSFGRTPSLSPDGSRIAFTRGDDEVHVLDIATKRSECILRARQTEVFARGSFAVPPAWSTNGAYLLFRTSMRRRRSEAEVDAAFVAKMHAAQKRTRQREARTGRKRVADYEFAIEMASSEQHHAMGIIDTSQHRVWLRDGYWTDAAWAPLVAR